VEGESGCRQKRVIRDHLQHLVCGGGQQVQAGEGQERYHLHHLVCGGGKRVQAKESDKGSSSSSNLRRGHQVQAGEIQGRKEFAHWALTGAASRLVHLSSPSE
jgi:hypothetical protein